MLQPYFFFDKFTTDLQSGMEKRFLKQILNLEGGWEYWIQIDFPAWLDDRYQTQYDFRREVQLDNTNLRLDWLINSNFGDYMPVAVEIKAQTHKYETNNFIRDVKVDITKLDQLSVQYYKLMLAAVIDGPTEEKLIDLQFKRIAVYPNEQQPLVIFYAKEC